MADTCRVSRHHSRENLVVITLNNSIRRCVRRILTVRTCDDFYSIMAVLAREMLEFGLMEPNHLVQVGSVDH